MRITAEEFDKRIRKATSDVKAMDAIDGAEDNSLVTVLFAMEAGLKNPESGAQYDAYVMLKRIIHNGAKQESTQCKN